MLVVFFSCCTEVMHFEFRSIGNLCGNLWNPQDRVLKWSWSCQLLPTALFHEIWWTCLISLSFLKSFTNELLPFFFSKSTNLVIHETGCCNHHWFLAQQTMESNNATNQFSRQNISKMQTNWSQITPKHHFEWLRTPKQTCRVSLCHWWSSMEGCSSLWLACFAGGGLQHWQKKKAMTDACTCVFLGVAALVLVDRVCWMHQGTSLGDGRHEWKVVSQKFRWLHVKKQLFCQFFAISREKAAFVCFWAWPLLFWFMEFAEWIRKHPEATSDMNPRCFIKSSGDFVIKQFILSPFLQSLLKRLQLCVFWCCSTNFGLWSLLNGSWSFRAWWATWIHDAFSKVQVT